MRVVEFFDYAGRAYAGIDRIVGLISTEGVVVHQGLRGFLGPEIVPPRVYVVTHRQVISRAREEKRKAKRAG